MTQYTGSIKSLRRDVIDVLRANATLADHVSDDPPDTMGGEPDTTMGGRVFVGIAAAVVRQLGRRRDPDDPTLTAPTLTIRSWIRRQPDKIRGSGVQHSYDDALDRGGLLLSVLSAPSLSLDTLTLSVTVLDGWHRVEVTATGSAMVLTS